MNELQWLICAIIQSFSPTILSHLTPNPTHMSISRDRVLDRKCLTMTHFVCNTKLRFDFWILYHILSSLNWWICWKKEGVEILSFYFWNLTYDIISSFQAICTLQVVFDAEPSLFTMSFTLTWTRLEASFTLNTGFFFNQGSLEKFAFVDISAKLYYIASCTFHSTFKMKCLVGGAKSVFIFFIVVCIVAVKEMKCLVGGA